MNNNDILNKANQLLEKIQSKLNLQQTINDNPDNNISNVDVINVVEEKSESKNIDNTQCDSIIEEKLDNIAIIQSFHGTDVKRILATTRQLNYAMSYNPKASEFVFVEAQSSKNLASFAWVKNYGIKYIFKKIPKESEGLFLKTALWNIGAANCKAEKLCFIDSDCILIDKSWIKKSYDEFENYDVLSLFEKSLYENHPTNKSYNYSIGYNIASSNEKNFQGHIGFTLGMTRKAYDLYGKFEAFNRHSDMWFWHRVLGTNVYKELIGWTPYKTTEEMKYGLPFKVGYLKDVICKHLDHGYYSVELYKAYGWISYYGTTYPFEDIVYDRNDIEKLPIWNSLKNGQIVKNCFARLNQDKKNAVENFKNIEEIFMEESKKIYGEIDEDHPLIIYTGFVTDFKHKNIESVIEFKEHLENISKIPFTFVCFTNEITVKEGQERDLDVIPFSSEKVRKDRTLWEKEIFRKNVQIPKNSTCIYLDINKKIEKLDIYRK